MIKLTCSILCYNYGKYLERAIISCLEQDKGSYEIEVIVIDDGSTDNTPDICKKYENAINYYRSKNEGFAASLTKAIQYAQGDYVCLLDADDYFAKDKIISLLPFMENRWLYIADTAQYINEFGELILGRASGCTSTVTVNRQAVLPLLPAENELYFSVLNKIGTGIHLNKIGAYYRLHDNNMTDRKIPGKWQIYLATMTNNLVIKLRVISTLDKLPWNVHREILLNVIYELRAQSYYHWLESSLELKNRSKAYKYYFFMLYWSIKAHKWFNTFNLKMLIKTLMMKPSFPK